MSFPVDLLRAGAKLQDAAPLCSRVQGCRTGLLLRFDHASIIVMDYCDDMRIIPGDVPPTMPGDELTIGAWTAVRADESGATDEGGTGTDG